MWLGEGVILMTEQEFPDEFLRDRINMLLDNRDQNCQKVMPQKSSKVFDKMLESEYAAEQFISLLPKWEKDLFQGYIDSLIDMFSTDEPFLYQQGIFDGIRVMKFIHRL